MDSSYIFPITSLSALLAFIINAAKLGIVCLAAGWLASALICAVALAGPQPVKVWGIHRRHQSLLDAANDRARERGERIVYVSTEPALMLKRYEVHDMRGWVIERDLTWREALRYRHT
jgi:hypothetical protein